MAKSTHQPEPSPRGGKGFGARGKTLKNERGQPSSHARNAARNKNLWQDPTHINAAEARVVGAGIDKPGTGTKQKTHPQRPGVTHYHPGNVTSTRQTARDITAHQDAIIDKHHEGGAIFAHSSETKDGYTLPPESTSLPHRIADRSGR